MKIIEYMGEPQDYFFKKDFCIFDPLLYGGITNLLEDNEIPFTSLGLNYFKKKNRCPALIQLKKLSLTQKEFIFNVMVDEFEMYGDSPLDHNSIVTVFFDSELDIVEVIENIKNMMVQKNKLFRFYDSRVIMFLPIYLSLNYQNFNLFKITSPNGWCFTINGGFFKLNNTNKKYKFDVNIYIELKNEIESKFKNEISFKDFEAILNFKYLNLELSYDL